MTQLICSETHAVSRLRVNSWSKGFKLSQTIEEKLIGCMVLVMFCALGLTELRRHAELALTSIVGYGKTSVRQRVADRKRGSSGSSNYRWLERRGNAKSRRHRS